MKAAGIVLGVVVLIAAAVGAGMVGLPILIEKRTADLRSDLEDVKQRLMKAEEFIKKEEEGRKAGPLASDADIQTIIKTANTLLSKLTSLEESVKRDLTSVQEMAKKQGVRTEETLKKQAEAMDQSLKEVRSRLDKITFDAAMAGIRGHLLKVQIELKAKNLGTAKTEIDLVNEIFEKTKGSASGEQRKAIEEIQSGLKNTKSEMDANLPAAINRIDFLWHEMGKLIRKG